MILVDTPIWSLSLRRKAAELDPAERHVTQLLYELVDEGRVELLGPVRQELLSGIEEKNLSFEGFETTCEISQIPKFRSKITRRQLV